MPARPGHALSAMLLGLIITAGCGNPADSAAGDPNVTSNLSTPSDPLATGATGSSTTTLANTHADASDEAWEESSEILVSLRDGGSVGGDGVTVDGDVVTISAAGTID